MAVQSVWQEEGREVTEGGKKKPPEQTAFLVQSIQCDST